MKLHTPFLSIPFRPFFFLAAIIAMLNPSFWILSLSGSLVLSTSISPLFWHGHEMVFGFTEALLGGFLLTASANWTQTEPYRGGPLLLLATVWVLERASFFLPLSSNALLFAGSTFFPLLIGYLFFTVRNHPKQRNVFIPIVTALFLAKLAHLYGHLDDRFDLESSGLQSGVAIIRMLVFIIAGRVLPFFTRKRLDITIEVKPFLTRTAVLSLALLCLPQPEGTPLWLTELILFIALVANAARNYALFDKRTLRVPMLLVLHVGINLLLLGIALELLGGHTPSLLAHQAVLHTTLAGGLGVVAIGIMTRVSLGHTGRVIQADSWTIVSYLSIFSGALLRVLLPVVYPNQYLNGLYLALALWAFGFFVFLIGYFRIWTSKRADA